MVTNDACKRKTIFIVDDIPENIDIFIGFLEDHNFEIAVATNAKDFFNQIALVKPDIVLLDIIMPDIDGFDVCRWLKQRDEYKEIPVIFMSALSETLDKVKGLTLGAADYITKPIEHAELLARINVHLELKASKDMIIKKNEKLKKLNSELTEALEEINTLKGLLPICGYCKKIRGNDAEPFVQKSWINVEKYFTDKCKADFTHSICPDCMKEHHPDVWLSKYRPSQKT